LVLFLSFTVVDENGVDTDDGLYENIPIHPLLSHKHTYNE